MASTDARESTVTSSGGPMAAGVGGPTRASIGARTLRQDRWWLYPAVTFTVFFSFVVYSTIRAFMGRDYFAEPYLSPFYSPCLGDCVEGSSDFGQPFGWFPLSAALIILIFPLGFRMTCYYYRKAYYRAFWLSPPACGVAEPHAAYTGETRFPLILQNVHRWFWYATFVVALILTWDVVLAFGPAPGESDGIHMGLGTVLMLINVVLHLALPALLPLVPPHRRRPAAALQQAPGALQALDLGLQAERPARATTRGCSLFSVALVDLYIFLLAAGVVRRPAVLLRRRR